METAKVRDLMVPLAEYATVGSESTLYEAVMALEAAQEYLGGRRYHHRAILVLDDGGHVTGKISLTAVLKGLEPKYQEIGDDNAGVRFGFSKKFMKSLMDSFGMWQKPLDDICRKAVEIKVKDIMYTPAQGEYVEENAPLDAAIHQLVLTSSQSLLVVDDKQAVVGVLRLTDVFAEVCRIMKACEL